MRLSACIITYNEADRIEACVRSLSFCDEILVVDSHSTDGTRELAQRLGARVIERDWPGYRSQKQFAVESARNDWVLCLDADERLSEPLRAEIERLERQLKAVRAEAENAEDVWRNAFAFNEIIVHAYICLCFQIWVELKTMPVHFNLIFVREHLQTRFELPFSDVTKGTSDI